MLTPQVPGLDYQLATSAAECQVSLSFLYEGKSTQRTPTATQPSSSIFFLFFFFYQFTLFYLAVPNLTNFHAKLVLFEQFCPDGLSPLVLNTSLGTILSVLDWWLICASMTRADIQTHTLHRNTWGWMCCLSCHEFLVLYIRLVSGVWQAGLLSLNPGTISSVAPCPPLWMVLSWVLNWFLVPHTVPYLLFHVIWTHPPPTYHNRVRADCVLLNQHRKG